MWKIKSINKYTYNCFQYIVTTMAHFYNCDYQMMMLELWGFKYNYNCHGNIGEKLGLCWNGEIERRKELLSKYHGLQFTMTEFASEDILDKINKKLIAAPLAVYLDSYECHWLPFYQKQHRAHTIILTDKRSGKYAFIDQYNDQDQNSEIEFSFIECNCQRIVEFNYSPAHVIQNEYLLEINHCLQIFIKKNTLEQYLNFLHDMKTCLNIRNEIIADDPISSKLVMYLKNIGDDRINLIEALGYVEIKLKISLQSLKELLYSISQRYEKLRAYIIKCAFIKRNPDMNKISSEVDEIFDLEKNVFQGFKNILDGQSLN